MNPKKEPLWRSQMIAILSRDFNRAPVKRRHEYSDGNGRVLIPNSRTAHYYNRPFTKAISLGYLDFFSRCGCAGPCNCETNGWHITKAGITFLEGLKEAKR